MNSQQRRAQIVRVFNHRMDKNARELEPGLTEQERYDLAIADLARIGIGEISENDMVHALANAQNAHIDRRTKPARTGLLMSEESSNRANEVVNGILDIYLHSKEK